MMGHRVSRDLYLQHRVARESPAQIRVCSRFHSAPNAPGPCCPCVHLQADANQNAVPSLDSATAVVPREQRLETPLGDSVDAR
jgi:hypothetical protein